MGDGKLVVRKPRYFDVGKYNCIAQNILGTARGVASLIVRGESL